MKKLKFTYEKSGVNINAADNFVKFISNISTKNKGKKSTVILVVLAQLQIYQKNLIIQKLLPAQMVLAQKLK